MTSERKKTGDNHSKSMSSHSCSFSTNDEAFKTNKMDAVQLLGSVVTRTPSTNLPTESRRGHEKPSKKALVNGVQKNEKLCGKQLIYPKSSSSSCEDLPAVGPSSSYGDGNDNIEDILDVSSSSVKPSRKRNMKSRKTGKVLQTSSEDNSDGGTEDELKVQGASVKSRSKNIRSKNVKYRRIIAPCSSSSETSENDGTDDETETNSNTGSRRTNQTDTIQIARLVLDNDDDDSGDDDGDTDNGGEENNDDGSGDDDGDEDNEEDENPLKRNFLVFLQMMLSCCLEPDFQQGSQDSYFGEPETKIEEKLQQMRDLLKSQAWNNEFREVLEKFSYLDMSSLSYKREGCEVCRRAGRIASKCLQFRGQCYNKETFESVEDDAGQGKMVFEAGIKCALRSNLYHGVFHYKYELHKKCKNAINKFSIIHDDAPYVLDKCLDNEDWMLKRYEEFINMEEKVMKWYTTDGRS